MNLDVKVILGDGPRVTTNTTEPAPAKRPRGRPKGSRNRAAPPETEPAVRPMAMRLDVAARSLGVSMSTLLRLVAAGEIETVRIGAMRLITVASLDALLRRGVARIER